MQPSTLKRIFDWIARTFGIGPAMVAVVVAVVAYFGYCTNRNGEAITQVLSRLDSTSVSITAQDQRVTNLEYRFNSLDKQFSYLSGRVSGMETILQGVQIDVAAIKAILETMRDDIKIAGAVKGSRK